MKKVKLLLVDDQELIRESLSIVLSLQKDFEIVGTAANGEEAIKLAERSFPDIVLMDIDMPLLNGIEATKVIKSRLPQTEVIILTTFKEIDVVTDALKNGAVGYLLKAINPEDLIAGIKLVHRGGTLIPQELAKQLLLRVPAASMEKTLSETYGLSAREIQILECLSNGLSNKQMSEKLYLSEGTIKNYVSRVYSKLDVKDRQDAIQKLKDDGVI
ncbi:response regulator transcription factor [Metabacillus endolithicus]|uniref:Response regulator n=1 Tax=Metabacillus endolithicus TaxID=1535204 RepID=A0ABW5C2G4_9BACI|nr:response regulator transcription factor [Metabacillus endolithicus]UPG65154.1 response regulator transcription factor [Metabacillus endolithicus]